MCVGRFPLAADDLRPRMVRAFILKFFLRYLLLQSAMQRVIGLEKVIALRTLHQNGIVNVGLIRASKDCHR
jgi:hypothetical protein